jgi:hypothetical protein
MGEESDDDFGALLDSLHPDPAAGLPRAQGPPDPDPEESMALQVLFLRAPGVAAPLDVGGDGEHDALLDELAHPGAGIVVKQARRGPDACKRMNAGRLKKLKERKKAAEKEEKRRRRDTEQTVSQLAPGAAKIVGFKNTRIRQGMVLSLGRVINILRCAFIFPNVLKAQNRYVFKAIVESTVLEILLAQMTGCYRTIAQACLALKAKGYQVIVAWATEWDEAKMNLQSIGNILLQSLHSHLSDLKKKYKEVAGNATYRVFQQAVSHTILNMSGEVVIVAIRGEGERVERRFHWIYPPIALADSTHATMKAGLSRGPLHLSNEAGCREVVEAADVTIAVPVCDRGPGNVEAVADWRAIVETKMPKECLMDEEWCDIHGNNLIRGASSDLTKMCGKAYSWCALFKTAQYAIGGLKRVKEWVTQNVRRHPGEVPEPAVLAENRRAVDSIYDLESEAHYRVLPDGTKVPTSLRQDLDAHLLLHTGSLKTDHVDHYCFDPATGLPCCESLEDCHDRFVLLYMRLFLGRGWPLPTMSRFTHLRTFFWRMCLGLMTHGVILVLLEEYIFEGVVLVRYGEEAATFRRVWQAYLGGVSPLLCDPVFSLVSCGFLL